MFGHSFEERYGPWRGDFLKTSFMSAGAEGFDQGSISGGGLDIFDQFWDPNFGAATAGYWPETAWDPFGGMTNFDQFGGGNLGTTLYGTGVDPFWYDPAWLQMGGPPPEEGMWMTEPPQGIGLDNPMDVLNAPEWLDPITQLALGNNPYGVTYTAEGEATGDPDYIPITGELDPRRLGNIQNVAWPQPDPITGELKLEPVPDIEIPIEREWEEGYKPKRTDPNKPEKKPEEPAKKTTTTTGTTTPAKKEEPKKSDALGYALLALQQQHPMGGGYAPFIGPGPIENMFRWPGMPPLAGPLSDYLKRGLR